MEKRVIIKFDVTVDPSKLLGNNEEIAENIYKRIIEIFIGYNKLTIDVEDID